MASIEIGGGEVFITLGRVEIYGRRERPSRWAWERDREERALDVMAGRFRLTVSKAPTEAERAASREARLELLMRGEDEENRSRLMAIMAPHGAAVATTEEPQASLRDAA